MHLAEISFDEFLNFVEYPYLSSNLLVLTTRGNQILVYDLNRNSTIQTIENKHASNSFVNISCSESEPVLLTNTSDGYLHLYEYNKLNQFKIVKKVNLEQLYTNYLSQNFSSCSIENSEETCHSMLCIGLHLISIENKIRLVESSNENKNLIACVATSAFIFLIDMNVANLIYLMEFKNMPYNENLLNVSYLLPQLVEFSLVNKQIKAALHSLFQNEIYVIKCADLFLNNEKAAAKQIHVENLLSVLPK